MLRLEEGRDDERQLTQGGRDRDQLLNGLGLAGVLEDAASQNAQHGDFVVEAGFRESIQIMQFDLEKTGGVITVLEGVGIARLTAASVNRFVGKKLVSLSIHYASII
jgi:hypothetical protein